MNNLKHLMKKKFLWKMTTLYLCIFLLPTSIISMFVLRYTMNQFGESLISQQALLSSNSMMRLEKWNDTCESIIAQLSSSDVMRYDLSKYSSQKELQATLHQLSTAHAGLEHIWCYIPENNLLLSGTDSLTVNRLNNARYIFSDDISQSSAISLLQNGRSLRGCDRYNNTDCILLPYSFNKSFGNGIHKYLIVFQIDQEYLDLELQNTLGISLGAVNLYDANNDLLASVQQGADIVDFPSDQSLECINMTSCRVYGRFSIDADHLQLAIKTPGQHWTMLGLYQDTSGSANMFSIQQRLLLLFASLFALGLIAVIIIIYKLYMPVHSLRAIASQIEWQSNSETIDDDYEYIESCIDHIAIDNAQLRDTLRSHKQRNRAMISSLLFEGRVQSFDELISLYDDESKMPLGNRYWVVAILCGSDVQQQYCSSHEECSPPAMRFQDGCLLLYFDELPGNDVFTQSGVQSIRQTEGTVLNDIPLHCAQVLFMLSCDPESLKQTIDEKYEYILRTPKEKKADVLQKWFETLEYKNPLEAVRALAGLTLKIFMSQNHGRMEAPEWFYLPENLSSVLCEERGQRFLELLKAQFNVEPDENTNDLEAMQAYISAQFDSPSFSIKKMAADFSMSISSLSSYFKQQSGILLSDYITEMKMEKAKFLLKTTSMSINDISLAVGYFNVTSFNRRFNLRIGMSPKEYRAKLLLENS